MSTNTENGEHTQRIENCQYIRIVRLVLQAHRKGEDLARLIADPAAVFIEAGLPIQFFDRDAFSAYFHDVIQAPREGGPSLYDTMVASDGELDLDSIGCEICKIGTWAMATTLVAVGKAGLAVLTVKSAPVLAVAALLGVSAKKALLLVKGLTAIVSKGVSAVSEEICRWMNAC